MLPLFLGGIPVPWCFWKLIKDLGSGRGVVIIGSNWPFPGDADSSEEEQDYYGMPNPFCFDRCTNILDDYFLLDYIKDPYVVLACEFENTRIDSIPADITISGLLEEP